MGRGTEKSLFIDLLTVIKLENVAYAHGGGRGPRRAWVAPMVE